MVDRIINLETSTDEKYVWIYSVLKQKFKPGNKWALCLCTRLLCILSALLFLRKRGTVGANSINVIICCLCYSALVCRKMPFWYNALYLMNHFGNITQVISDVRNDHEIYLGKGHPVRLSKYGDCRKIHVRKYFPAIFGHKWTFCLFQYCYGRAKSKKYGNFYSVSSILRGIIF